MNFNQIKKRIRRFLRDPRGKLWSRELILDTFNHVQENVHDIIRLLENVVTLRVPPYYQWSYMYEWELSYLPTDENFFYQCFREDENSGIVVCNRWEKAIYDGYQGSSANEAGASFMHPWEAFMGEVPSELVRIRLPRDFDAVKMLAWDQEPIDPTTSTQVINNDFSHVSRAGIPENYYFANPLQEEIVLHPRPSTVTFADLSSDLVYDYVYTYDWEANIVYFQKYYARFKSDDEEYLQSIASDSVLNLDADKTIEIWVNRTTIAQQTIMSWWNNASNNWQMQFNAADSILIQSTSGGSNRIQFTSDDAQADTADQWYQIIYVLDFDTQANSKLYVNGTSVDITYTVFSPASVAGSPLTYFGRLGNGNFDYNGLLARFRIWNRVLTDDEITTLYNSGNGYAYNDMPRYLRESVAAGYDLDNFNTVIGNLSPLDNFNTVSFIDLPPEGKISETKGKATITDSNNREIMHLFEDDFNQDPENSVIALFDWEAEYVIDNIQTVIRYLDLEESIDNKIYVEKLSATDLVYGTPLTTLDDDGQLLLVYSANPRRIVADNDSPSYPAFISKYIEYGVISRLYGANTDGRIQSLSRYWDYRYRVGLELMKRYKSRRGQDMKYQLSTQQRPASRERRLPRFPSGYPAVPC